MANWLRNGEASIAFAVFTCVGDQVEVLALIAATEYIDRKMAKQEARDTWKKLIDAGWHRVTDTELSDAKMNTRLLKLFIHD